MIALLLLAAIILLWRIARNRAALTARALRRAIALARAYLLLIASARARYLLLMIINLRRLMAICRCLISLAF